MSRPAETLVVRTGRAGFAPALPAATTVALLVLALFAVPTGLADARPPITQAQSGKTFRLAVGQTATLRLSNRWRWSEPQVSGRAVELTPVEYFADPGFREGRVEALVTGLVTIRSLGTPACSGCGLASRRFRVTIRVGPRQ